MAATEDRKIIEVNVSRVESDDIVECLEVSLPTSRLDLECDATVLENKVRVESVFLKSYSRADLHFLKPSILREGKWVTIGKSPLKHATTVKCIVGKKEEITSPSPPMRISSSVLQASSSSTAGHRTSPSPVVPSTTSSSSICVGRTKSFTETFQLPTNWPKDIRDKFDNNLVLSFNQDSTICRMLATRIIDVTIQPDKDLIQFVVQLFFRKYPSVYLADNSDQNAKKLYYFNKLKECLARKTRPERDKQSLKGGRPKKKVCMSYDSPGHFRASPNEQSGLDMVSYDQNCKKIVELVGDNVCGSRSALRELLNMTFKIRRSIILTLNSSTTSEQILCQHCPLLRKPEYLYEELDLILGEGTCQELHERWDRCVNVIFLMALNSTSTAVAKFRKIIGNNLPRETKSMLSIQLLPYIFPTGKRKMEVAQKYLIDIHDEAAVNLENAIKSTDRCSPYILKLRDSYLIILDRKPLCEVHLSKDALLALIAVYYVFNIEWCSEVQNSLYFLQGELLEKTDNLPVNARFKSAMAEYKQFKEQQRHVEDTDSCDAATFN